MTKKEETGNVRFLIDHEVDDEHKGTDDAEKYKAGQVVKGMNPASINHFVSRGIAVPVTSSGKTTDGEKFDGVRAPEGPTREHAIENAIRGLDPRKKGNFDDKGKPALAAVAKILGWEPKVEELDAAFDVVLKAGGLDLGEAD